MKEINIWVKEEFPYPKGLIKPRKMEEYKVIVDGKVWEPEKLPIPFCNLHIGSTSILLTINECESVVKELTKLMEQKKDKIMELKNNQNI